MKNNFAKYIISALIVAVSMPAVAKTAEWSVTPQYSDMEQLVPGVYKVKRGIYTGVIDANGKEIIKMTTDSITPFVGGQALVLTPAAEGSYRLQAILHDDLTQSPVNEEVWVEEYPFFSEGMLPVRNNLGFYGYMDPAGRMVLQPSYINVHPFSEGYAAVSKRPKNKIGQFISKGIDKVKDQFKKDATIVYINRGGNEMKLSKDLGKLKNGSTFNNGVALVQTKTDEYALINTAGARVRKMPSSGNYEYDDRYVYIDENYDEHPMNEDYLTTRTAVVDNAVKVFREGNAYGYRTGSDVILPAQFDEADLFYDDYAMARVNRKWGILKLVDGTFTCTAPAASKAAKKTARTKKAAAAPVGYTVTTPSAYEKATLTLSLDASGNVTSDKLEANGTNERKFPLAKPAGNYVATLATDNLTLMRQYNGTEVAEQTVTEAPRLRVSVSPSSTRADINDNAIITVTIANPGDVAVTVPVKITGTGMTTVNRNVTIPANSSRRVSAAFAKVYEKEVRTVTVTAGTVKVTKSISVTPFYVKL